MNRQIIIACAVAAIFLDLMFKSIVVGTVAALTFCAGFWVAKKEIAVVNALNSAIKETKAFFSKLNPVK